MGLQEVWRIFGASQAVGEDPSIFATALETLAIKALGDMGQTSQLPIRDIVDRCWVWESHADSDNRWVGRPVPERALPIYTVNDANGGGVGWVATVAPVSHTGPDQLERLLRQLLPTPVLPLSPPQPVPSDLELLLQ